MHLSETNRLIPTSDVISNSLDSNRIPYDVLELRKVSSVNCGCNVFSQVP